MTDLQDSIFAIVDSNIALAADQGGDVDEYICNIGRTMSEEGLTGYEAHRIAQLRILDQLAKFGLRSTYYS